MLHLFGRESRGALHELGVFRIVTGERQGIQGDLLFADRVIGQELGQVRRRELRPRAGRRVKQRKRGEDLLEADRIGGVTLWAGWACHEPDHTPCYLLEKA